MSCRAPRAAAGAPRRTAPRAVVPAAIAVLALLALPSPLLAQALGAEGSRGPLDRASPQSSAGRRSGQTGNAAGLGDTPPAALRPQPGVNDQASLRRAVRAEQDELERLPRPALERRARRGERGAQVVLGIDFAKEARSLASVPAAANDATSDAVRWYSLAASRGFPGAPSLDIAGVRRFPVRVQRGGSGR